MLLCLEAALLDDFAPRLLQDVIDFVLDSLVDLGLTLCSLSDACVAFTIGS